MRCSALVAAIIACNKQRCRAEGRAREEVGGVTEHSGDLGEGGGSSCCWALVHMEAAWGGPGGLTPALQDLSQFPCSLRYQAQDQGALPPRPALRSRDEVNSQSGKAL
jgi:hypothetical protein